MLKSFFDFLIKSKKTKQGILKEPIQNSELSNSDSETKNDSNDGEKFELTHSDGGIGTKLAVKFGSKLILFFVLSIFTSLVLFCISSVPVNSQKNLIKNAFLDTRWNLMSVGNVYINPFRMSFVVRDVYFVAFINFDGSVKHSTIDSSKSISVYIDRLNYGIFNKKIHINGAEIKISSNLAQKGLDISTEDGFLNKERINGYFLSGKNISVISEDSIITKSDAENVLGSIFLKDDEKVFREDESRSGIDIVNDYLKKMISLNILSSGNGSVFSRGKARAINIRDFKLKNTKKSSEGKFYIDYGKSFFTLNYKNVFNKKIDFILKSSQIKANISLDLKKTSGKIGEVDFYTKRIPLLRSFVPAIENFRSDFFIPFRSTYLRGVGVIKKENNVISSEIDLSSALGDGKVFFKKVDKKSNVEIIFDKIDLQKVENLKNDVLLGKSNMMSLYPNTPLSIFLNIFLLNFNESTKDISIKVKELFIKNKFVFKDIGVDMSFVKGHFSIKDAYAEIESEKGKSFVKYNKLTDWSKYNSFSIKKDKYYPKIKDFFETRNESLEINGEDFSHLIDILNQMGSGKFFKNKEDSDKSKYVCNFSFNPNIRNVNQGIFCSSNEFIVYNVQNVITSVDKSKRRSENSYNIGFINARNLENFLDIKYIFLLIQNLVSMISHEDNRYNGVDDVLIGVHSNIAPTFLNISIIDSVLNNDSVNGHFSGEINEKEVRANSNFDIGWGSLSFDSNIRIEESKTNMDTKLNLKMHDINFYRLFRGEYQVMDFSKLSIPFSFLKDFSGIVDISGSNIVVTENGEFWNVNMQLEIENGNILCQDATMNAFGGIANLEFQLVNIENSVSGSVNFRNVSSDKFLSYLYPFLKKNKASSLMQSVTSGNMSFGFNGSSLKEIKDTFNAKIKYDSKFIGIENINTTGLSTYISGRVRGANLDTALKKLYSNGYYVSMKGIALIKPKMKFILKKSKLEGGGVSGLVSIEIDPVPDYQDFGVDFLVSGRDPRPGMVYISVPISFKEVISGNSVKRKYYTERLEEYIEKTKVVKK